MSNARRIMSMASGTAVSRATGLLRVLVLAWVLGFTQLSDAFNLANTVPNMLFDIVLGGILSATFIPVFIERLATDTERRAWRSISNVVSAAVLLLFAASLLSWVGAPWIIQGFTFLQHTTSHRAQLALVEQESVATQFLRWFVPQIFFYGIIGIATGLLNIRKKFGVAAWAPVANNVICIVVLIWFHLVDPTPTLRSLSNSSDLMWLGLGTTAGVAVQFLMLVPSLRRSQLGRLRFSMNLSDPAVRAVGRLGSWTLGVVATNQASLYVVLSLAFATGGNGPVSAYTYGWAFMQMPYAVIVISVLGVLTPQLAALSTEGKYVQLGEQLSKGLRQAMVIIIPCTFGLIVLSQPIVGILLNHVHSNGHILAGTVLAILAAGLPGFTLFQLCVRGLQAMQRARDVFVLYVLENALTVGLCWAIGRHSMAGLSASVSVAYTVSGLVAIIALHQYGVHVHRALIGVHVRRAVLASLIMAIVIAVVYAASTWSGGAGLVIRSAVAALAGGAVYLGFLLVTQRRQRGV